MAEKKVSGKNKNGLHKSSEKRIQVNKRDTAYDDFLTQYSKELRKRSTRTIPEPKKHQLTDDRSQTARSGEINPHLSINPAAEHHILTKRSGRILTDDTGFKAHDYYQRFELKAEMPEFSEEDSITAQGGFEESSIPGQQTMADLVANNLSQESIAVPVESKISEENDDPFSSAYKSIRSEIPSFGKSEKLRAIARTATDDVGMEPESQLSFPAFDPLFKFDAPEKKKKNHSRKKQNKKGANPTEQQPFDIEEHEIVTSHVQSEEEISADNFKTTENEKKIKGKRFFEVINNNKLQEEEPVFEINSKQDIKSTAASLKKIGRMHLIQTCALLLLGSILAVVSIIFNKSVENGSYNPTVFTAVNAVFLILAGVLCIKELLEGVKDIAKRRLTLNSGGVLIYATALIQSVAASLSSDFPESIRILAPAAILMMTTVTSPKLLLTNNARLAVSIMGGNNTVSLFKPMSDGGIEGSVNTKHSKDGGTVRCNTKTQMTTGIMKKLTNAVPKPFGGNASYVIGLIFSLTVGIASGVITKSFSNAVTAICAMLMACLPVSYLFTASFMLFRENNNLAEKKSSIISYKAASEVTKTNAAVFDTCEFIESSACSIHSIKTFGSTDPKKATLCCAAAIKAGKSPLSDIMQQVVEQGGEEIPETQDVIVTAGGIAALVGNNKVLLGTKEFLSENHILIPEDDYEQKYISGDRKLLFLSVNGEFCMLLIVSYHIKRSVSAFFKYLVQKNISILIHSSDPNIVPEYIEKKCRIPKGSVSALTETEALYFRDKSAKTESSLPADVFTDGKISSLFALLKSAGRLEKIAGILPPIFFALSLAGALAVAIPIILSGNATTGNLYIILLRIICTAVATAVPMFISNK